jgi:hypothetical protein
MLINSISANKNVKQLIQALKIVSELRTWITLTDTIWTSAARPN